MHTDICVCVYECGYEHVCVRVPDMNTAATKRLGTVCVHLLVKPRMFIRLSKCTKSREPPCHNIRLVTVDTVDAVK